MLIPILEIGLLIGLTIAAWLRGWKAWSLLPLGIVFGLSFFIGLIMGFSGASIESIYDVGNIVGIILELAWIGTLIYMIVRPREKSQQATASNLASPAAPVAVEPLGKPVNVEPTGIVPATVLSPVAKARLTLPDNSEIPLTEPIRQIGRDDFKRIVSAETLKYISRQHLLISYENGKYFAEDRGSANGTKSNGIDIRGRGRWELRDGDRIDVAGVAVLTFKA